jgi:hypothetical protein
MAVIVEHNEKPNDQFVLLGTGFGMFKAMRGATLGDILSKQDEGEKTLAALCGEDGNILWADSSELTVISVDGQSPKALLATS